MKSAAIRTLMGAACVLTAVAKAPARTLFETGFDEPSLHAGLEDVDSAFEIGGGTIQRTLPAHDEDRHYVRTVDSDYFGTGDFHFEVSFVNLEALSVGTIQFIGLGNGTPNPGFYNEPGPANNIAGTGTGSVNLRIHSPDVVGGRVDWAFNYGVDGEGILVESIGYLTTVGLHRVRIGAVGDTLEMAVDEDYDGTFVPTFSTTIDLLAYPQIRGALQNESHAFFGTALSILPYDDFVIVPEPSSGLALLLGISLATHSRFRRPPSTSANRTH